MLISNHDFVKAFSVNLDEMIKNTSNEFERTNLEICKNGVDEFFSSDEYVARKYLMFNKSEPDDMCKFIEENLEKIREIKAYKLGESLKWFVNNIKFC